MGAGYMQYSPAPDIAGILNNLDKVMIHHGDLTTKIKGLSVRRVCILMQKSISGIHSEVKGESRVYIVSFAAVIRVVTQRSFPLTAVSGGEALRDDSNNGCEGD